MRNISPFTQRDFAIIGKRLFKDNPELAVKYIEPVSNDLPVLFDLGQLEQAYQLFCESEDLYPDTLIKGIKWNRDLTRDKCVFVGVAIKLYDPRYLIGDSCKLKSGLSKSIATLFRHPHSSAITQYIKEAKFCYKCNRGEYRDYCLRVNQICNYISKNL